MSEEYSYYKKILESEDSLCNENEKKCGYDIDNFICVPNDSLCPILDIILSPIPVSLYEIVPDSSFDIDGT